MKLSIKISPLSACFWIGLGCITFWEGCTKEVPPVYSQKTLDYNLGYAVADGRTDAVKYWLEQGADANAAAPRIKDFNIEMDGQPMVLAAAQSQDLGSLRMLLDHGADVNAHWVAPKDCHCYSGEQILETPLIAAAAIVDVDEVKLLLDRGADVRISPDGTEGKTLLSYVHFEYPKQFNYEPGDVGGGRLPDDGNVEGRYKQVVALIHTALQTQRPRKSVNK